MKKRFLSALLAMAMVLTMLPTAAFATGEAVVAGFSANANDAITDINTATKLNAQSVLGSEDAENLLWFVVTGLTAKSKYSLSVKNGEKEILTKYAISYEDSENTDRVFTAAGANHLIYVSLDEFSELSQ